MEEAFRLCVHVYSPPQIDDNLGVTQLCRWHYCRHGNFPRPMLI